MFSSLPGVPTTSQAMSRPADAMNKTNIVAGLAVNKEKAVNCTLLIEKIIASTQNEKQSKSCLILNNTIFRWLYDLSFNDRKFTSTVCRCTHGNKDKFHYCIPSYFSRDSEWQHIDGNKSS